MLISDGEAGLSSHAKKCNLDQIRTMLTLQGRYIFSVWTGKISLHATIYESLRVLSTIAKGSSVHHHGITANIKISHCCDILALEQ